MRPIRLLRVLVVDDHEDTTESTARLLELHGFSVLKAFSGAEALKLVERENPEVVLMDISMPSMNGYDCARKIRELAKDCPTIIAVTGHGDNRHLGHSRDAGIDFHLIKPVEPDKLLAVVKAIKHLKSE